MRALDTLGMIGITARVLVCPHYTNGLTSRGKIENDTGYMTLGSPEGPRTRYFTLPFDKIEVESVESSKRMNDNILLAHSIDTYRHYPTTPPSLLLFLLLLLLLLLLQPNYALLLGNGELVRRLFIPRLNTRKSCANFRLSPGL